MYLEAPINENEPHDKNISIKSPGSAYYYPFQNYYPVYKMPKNRIYKLTILPFVLHACEM
jgi:hypothetical protein